MSNDAVKWYTFNVYTLYMIHIKLSQYLVFYCLFELKKFWLFLYMKGHWRLTSNKSNTQNVLPQMKLVIFLFALSLLPFRLCTMNFLFVCSHVVVGSTTGKIMLIDLRRKGSVVQHYKGAVGSLKSIACHKTEPYIVSVGLDRHILVHNLNSRALLQRVRHYLIR